MLEYFNVLNTINKSEYMITKNNDNIDELYENGDIFEILVELYKIL